MTLLLAAAASLLLAGSYLVIHAVIEADRPEVRRKPLPLRETRGAAAPAHRRAA